MWNQGQATMLEAAFGDLSTEMAAEDLALDVPIETREAKENDPAVSSSPANLSLPRSTVTSSILLTGEVLTRLGY